MLSFREKLGILIAGALAVYYWKKPIYSAGYSAYNTGATLVTGEPRGIRNNNPGNLMSDGSTVWNGQTGVDPNGYLEFATPIDGMRAMAITLYHYQQWQGLDTITGIITRWAPPSSNNTRWGPPSSNNTAAYIQDVSTRMGTNPNAVINVAQALPRLIPAIIWHENGQQPYSQSQIMQAIAAAGL